MIKVTLILDDKQLEGGVPGTLAIEMEGATNLEIAALVGDTVEIIARAMTEVAENHVQGNPELSQMVMDRLMTSSDRFTMIGGKI